MAQHPTFHGVDAAALSAFISLNEPAPASGGAGALPRFDMRPEDAPWRIPGTPVTPAAAAAPEAVVPTISVSDVIVGEGDGFVDIVVTLSEAATGTVTVDYTTADFTAFDSGVDTDAQSGTLTFAAGETTQTVRINLVDDSANEDLERLKFVLSAPAGATLDGEGFAWIEIVDNDQVRTTPDIFVRDVVVDEKAGVATFTVTLGNRVGQSSASTVTVDYATGGGTATSGADFTAVSGTLTFAPGESVKVVTVALTDDATNEGQETFRLDLADASGANIFDGSATATIGASDAATVATPSIVVQDMVVGEGDNYFDVVVTLSAPSTGTVTVNYATADFTASDNGVDVEGQSGSITFAPGETTQVVRIELQNDGAAEGFQRLKFELSGPSGATLDGEGFAWIEIIDNDDPQATPELYVQDVVVDEAAGVATFTVTLGNRVGQSSSGVVTVDYATAGGTATSGADFAATSGTLTFAPGESVKTVTVALTNDGANEGRESFTLGLSNASGATIVYGSATATVGASDAPVVGTPKIDVADVVADEGDNYVDVVVTLSAPSAGTVTVNYSTGSFTASDGGADLVGQSGTVTFAPGETTQVVRIEIANNGTAEELQSARFILTSPTGATLRGDGTAEIQILDNDDTRASPEIHVQDVVIDEKAGVARFTVSLGTGGGQSSSGVVTVDYSTANGTAVAGSDYVAASGTLVFAPGESSKVVEVALTDDALNESRETFFLDLSGAVGGEIDDGRGVASIEGANDANTSANPTITVLDRVVSEDRGYVDVVLKLSAPSTSLVTVAFTTVPGTAIGADYDNVSGTAYFQPGETTTVVRIELDENTTIETDESFTLELSAPTNATLGDTTATVTIVDQDDPAIRVVGDSLGDDVYTLQAATDRVVESQGGGRDRVESVFAHTLEVNVEDLTLTGSGSISGTGNASANTITGNAGGNVLDGAGGADTLIGGAGNDVYKVSSASDVITETSSLITEIDRVESSVDWTLGSNLEKLTLTGIAAIDGTGNTLDNTLTGNGGDNSLRGDAGEDTLTGGAGNDTLDGGSAVDSLTGGTGNDTYVVTNVADIVNETTTAAAEIDTVQSSVDWTLGANLEVLTLTGSASVDGTGNTLANTLNGNGGANSLRGDAGDDTLVGGSGNDTLDGGNGVDSMNGGTGNDTYTVGNTADRVTETSTTASEIDTVNASVSWTLGANLEKLTLTGSSAINGTGNTLANTLVGNAGVNTLTGGSGSDTVTGGGGADIFALNSRTGSDTITDFLSGTDDLRISQAGIRVGDGDTVVDGAVRLAGPGGFGTGAELVIITANIAGSITTASAAAAIGSATGSYTVGATRLFVVDNGTDSRVYLFTAADANAVVSASELSLLATLQGTASTTAADVIFGG